MPGVAGCPLGGPEVLGVSRGEDETGPRVRGAQRAERLQNGILLARRRASRDEQGRRLLGAEAPPQRDRIDARRLEVEFQVAGHHDAFRGRAERDDPVRVIARLHAEGPKTGKSAAHEPPQGPVTRERSG